MSEEKQEQPMKHRLAVAAMAKNMNRYLELVKKDTRIWTQADADAIAQFEQRLAPASIILLLRILGATRDEGIRHTEEQVFDQCVESRIYEAEQQIQVVPK